MLIPDDPIISSILRTGEPPWIANPTRVWTPFGYGRGSYDEDDEDDEDWEGVDGDVYAGNETDLF